MNGDSVSRALDFLQRNQLDYGEFRTLAAADPEMAGECRFDSTPFITALILYSLDFVPDPRAKTMVEKGLDFLLSEVEGPGLWRYWSSRNPQHEGLQPDLDVIGCVSQILWCHGREFPDNREFLLATRDAQGLFYTYMVPRPTTPPALRSEIGRLVSPESLFKLLAAGMLHEVDAVVNANVLLYLGEIPETEAALAYLLEVVRNKGEATCSKYYRDPWIVYYMFSRAFFAGVTGLAAARESILERLTAEAAMPGALEPPLRAALGACTLLNFGEGGPLLAESIRRIETTQQADGSWSRRPFYIGPAPYYGSEELTTGFCVEALCRSR